jgi:hypothetical protein
MPIGASRTKIGTVNHALVGYYDSTMFFGSLAPGTQVVRRGILERFRAEHGDKPIALLPQKFIVLTLNKLRPSVARSWLAIIYRDRLKRCKQRSGYTGHCGVVWFDDSKTHGHGTSAAAKPLRKP